VQPKLAARVRLLQAGDTNKNDPNDALSVAVAALRSKASREVTAEDHPAVLKVWSKRHRDLARLRTQVACRLHAVLCDLVPGGHPKEISAAQAARMLEQAVPSGAVALARAELAAEFLADLRRLDGQLRDTRKKLAAAVRASGTTLTQVFGVGPVITGIIIGDVAAVSRVPGRDHFAAYRHRPGRGVVGEPEDPPAVAARQPAHQPRHPHGRHHPDPAPAQRRPRVLRQEAGRGKDA
jgi:transposase